MASKENQIPVNDQPKTVALKRPSDQFLEDQRGDEVVSPRKQPNKQSEQQTPQLALKEVSVNQLNNQSPSQGPLHTRQDQASTLNQQKNQSEDQVLARNDQPNTSNNQNNQSPPQDEPPQVDHQQRVQEQHLDRPRSLFITENVDLKEILNRTSDGQSIIAIYDKTKNISKKRNKLVHLLLTDVLAKCSR